MGVWQFCNPAESYPLILQARLGGRRRYHFRGKIAGRLGAVEVLATLERRYCEIVPTAWAGVELLHSLKLTPGLAEARSARPGRSKAPSPHDRRRAWLR